MTLLDCESIDSINGSLEVITGAKRSAIESFLDSIDIDALYNGNSPPRCAPNDFLLDTFMRTFHSKLSCDATCWFHLTRVPGNYNFEAGILPLDQRLDSIWDFLFGLLHGAISKKQWNDFRQGNLQGVHHVAYDYAMKIEKPFYWGPYAILTKELAFKPHEVHNHDYFLVPEIVEDICICFEKIYKIDLLSLFQKGTEPCIVKFIDHNPREDCVRTALWHLYRSRRQERCSSYCSNCFDGRGIAVPRDRILKVEFPAYEPDSNDAAKIASEHSGQIGVYRIDAYKPKKSKPS